MAINWGWRRSSYVAAGLCLLCLAALAAATVWLRGSLPQLDGEKALPGLAAAVEVHRDDNGLVTLRAANMHDAYLALGYVHAQDRLWQMDLTRRTGAGRLSEVVGAATLDVDRFLRTLGLYRAAQANLSALPPDTRAAIDAYAAGVNAYIADPGGPLPLEFHLLGYRPEPWRAADSLVWGKLMAFQLSNNWMTELQRARLAERLTDEQIAQLWPGQAADAATTLSQGLGGIPRTHNQTAGRQARGRPSLPWRIMPKDASNSWVLDGSRTAGGRPILANDLHLGLEAPGVWYLARLETPETTLAGATAPGVPFLIAGHNGHIAWGFTTTHADTQDLFIEQLADAPDSYVTPEGPVAFTRREEVIAVDGGAPHSLTVRSTRHGPVINGAASGLPDLPADQVLSFAWPALLPDDGTVAALHALNQARDWSDAKDALRGFHAPLQNIVVADRSNIAFLSPGRIPLRRAGDGRRPVPGWSGEFDWQGFIPFEALPQAENPLSGQFVNANNRIVDATYPHLIAADWPEPYRAERIAELLRDAPLLDIERVARIQTDAMSMGARRLLPRLLAAAADTALARQAHRKLAAWDLVMDRDRAEPLIFSAWLWQLNREIFGDELGGEILGFSQAPVARLQMALDAQSAWCDDGATAGKEDCDHQIAKALSTAVERLQAVYGEDLEDWRWGDAHRARFPHPVLSRIPLLGEFFDFTVETDGGEYSVNRGGMPLGPAEATRYEHRHGATYRAIYDLADLDNSRFMIATGQSGNPLSDYYGSLAERWRDGQYLKLVGDTAAASNTLVLLPVSK